jgi:hypothetical protein
LRLLAAAEDLDDAHWAAASGAWLAQGERDDVGALRWSASSRRPVRSLNPARAAAMRWL